MRDAMRARDNRRTQTLRMAMAAAHNRKIELRRDLTDDEVVEVLGRQVKQRRESIDVYRAAGGNWLERDLVMVVTTLIFWAKVIEQQVRMMRSDGTLLSAGEWSTLLHFLFVSPGTLRKLVPRYLGYYRREFHP